MSVCCPIISLTMSYPILFASTSLTSDQLRSRRPRCDWINGDLQSTKEINFLQSLLSLFLELMACIYVHSSPMWWTATVASSCWHTTMPFGFISAMRRYMVDDCPERFPLFTISIYPDKVGLAKWTGRDVYQQYAFGFH